MPNEWGDELAPAAPRANEWGDRLFDPFAETPGNAMGVVNAARRAGRASLAGLNVLGAMGANAKREDYEREAGRLDSQAADIEQLAPTWTAENRATWAERARSTALQLRERAKTMEASAAESLSGAASQMVKAEKIPLSPDYEAYQRAEGWDAVKQFLKNPVEIPLTIAAEGAAGSVPAIAAGAAGAATAGVPGMAAGAGLGSFATEYASTLLETFREKGVDVENTDQLRQAFAEPELMADAKRRALARGVPVAVFDAISGGIAGRTVAPVARQGVKQVLKAGAREVGEQAALGMGGETAGQISEQLAATGRVDLGDLALKDIVAEGIGEVVPGAAQVTIGAATRDRSQQNLRKPGDDPKGSNAQGEQSRELPREAPASATTDTADLESAMGASLPDSESRDVLTGRSAEASARALKDVKVDFAKTVQSVTDALLQADATPAQLDALDFQLRVLEERKDKRRLKPDQVNASLGNTFLMEALPAAEVFPLVSRLADDSANIAALRKGIADMRGSAAPAAPTEAPAEPAALILTTEQRAQKAAELRQREAAATEQKRVAEVERQKAQAEAASAEKAKTQRVRDENTRLAAIEKTGRDPETKRVVDITRVPDGEIDTLDIEAEGITPQQLDAEMERRAKAAERAEAQAGSRGEELLEALRTVRLPLRDSALEEEMRKLVFEEMNLGVRKQLTSPRAQSLDRVAEALRDRGFEWAQTPADVIDHVGRALRGEKIHATKGGDAQPQFRRATVRAVRRPAAELEAETRRWWENFRIMAPAVARQVELRFGKPEDLVATGDVDAAEITGEEEAVYLRRGGARMIHLFERALRENTEQVTRLNLLHELGHAFYDTLDEATQGALVEQWRAEIERKTGPLFDAEGNLRDNVALGVQDDVQEWFAERLAHANDSWAKRRTDTRSRGDSLIATLAAQFRALLATMREYLDRAFGGDQLVRDFRAFLDQGDRWNDAGAAVEEAAGLAAASANFARREKVDTPDTLQKRYDRLREEFDSLTAEAQALNAELDAFNKSEEPDAGTHARVRIEQLRENERTTRAVYAQLTALRAKLEQANPVKAKLPEGMTAAQVIEQGAKADTKKLTEETESLLREYASLERTRDRYMDEGNRVPRHVLTGLSDLREQLEESLPGWRDRLKTLQANAPKTTPPTGSVPRVEGPQPEGGASALFESEEGTVSADATAAKRSQLEASTLRRPVGVVEWLKNMGSIFTNFRSAIPELPGGATGREFAAFRQGYRMLKAATEHVRKDAEEKVAHVVEPLQAIGREAVSPARYRELQKLQEIRVKQIEDGKPVNPELKKRIAEIDAELESVPYHLFRKVVLYRDLFFRSRLQGPSGEPLTLPFSLTRGEVESTLRDLHRRVGESQHKDAIEEALRRHYALVKDVRDGLLARGYVIPEELRNPLYFPHLVLEKTSGNLQRVKLDTAEDFRGYLVQLAGSDRAIESDYLTAMYHHLATVQAHNARQDIVERYWQPYDIKKKLEEEARALNQERSERGLGPVSWRQLVPEGHVAMTVDERIPVRPEYIINRQVLAERLGVALGEGDLQAQLRELGLSVTLTADDFKAALMAGEREQWVVPKPVADAMSGILARESRTAGLVEKVVTAPQSLWKRWTLFAPHTVIRYTYGNLVADMEKLFSADPAVFKYLRPAFREVRAFYAGEKPTADLRAAFERGVIDSVTAAEVTTMTSDLADRFEAFLTRREKVAETAKWIGRFGVAANRYREATFRYAKFKADLERMRNGAEPVYAGAFNRDVRAIKEETPEATRYAQAAEISRKTFGDYSDISVSGDALRRYLMPFYSWTEVNFRYHVNLFRNLGDLTAGAGAAQIARQTATAASRVLVARSISGVLLRLALPYVAVALWNNSGEREELEKTLSDEDRRRFHIIAGKDEQGRTIVVYAPTALSDFMRWFGGNDFARLAGEYGRGEITLAQLAHEWVSNVPADVANNALQGIGPVFKAAWTALFRRATFPDFFDQRTIPDHDVNWAVLGNVVDGFTADTLRRAIDKDYYASRDFGTWTQQLILQARRRDPEQWGYYATLDRVAAYQATHGGTVDFGTNNRADAEILSSFRRAIRAGDVPAALQFYQKLLDSGYTSERFAASVRAADPLGTLKKEYRKDFVSTLSESERFELENGYKYAERMKVFQRKERLLFPSDNATRGYRERFAAQGGRPDVFADIMQRWADLPEEEQNAKAESDMRKALQRR